MLRRTIAHPGNEQEEPAQAWNFGEKHGIPAFQNAVMRLLVPLPH